MSFSSKPLGACPDYIIPYSPEPLRSELPKLLGGTVAGILNERRQLPQAVRTRHEAP